MKKSRNNVTKFTYHLIFSLDSFVWGNMRAHTVGGNAGNAFKRSTRRFGALITTSATHEYCLMIARLADDYSQQGNTAIVYGVPESMDYKNKSDAVIYLFLRLCYDLISPESRRHNDSLPRACSSF